MHRAASLGPIDPQVWNGKDWVPALGYLAKYEELIEKSKNGSITKGEILLLLTQDLAMLNSFQQARELTTVLIKDWLAKYKFQNWITHQSNPDKLGQTVTYVEKQIRAEEIATSLSDHRDWKSHSRYLDLQCLRSVLRLEIDEFSEDHDLGMAIIDYNEFIRQYIQNNNFNNFIHSRFFF
jgi:hypothetical protein